MPVSFVKALKTAVAYLSDHMVYAFRIGSAADATLADNTTKSPISRNPLLPITSFLISCSSPLAAACI
jgi:hypothetical protein